MLNLNLNCKGGEIVKVEFDYSKLRGKIREFGRQDEFAEALEISTTTLSERLNNKSEFTQKEINKACEILKISTDEIPAYFFTPKVKEA